MRQRAEAAALLRQQIIACLSAPGLAPVGPSAIMRQVAAARGMSAEAIKSRRKDVRSCRLRAAAVWALRDAYPRQSSGWIGRQLGLDHSTILYHLKKMGPF